jgi:hypothetical protein
MQKKGREMILDDFTSGAYAVTLTDSEAQDKHLASGLATPVGPTRYTIFSVGQRCPSASPYGRSNALRIGNHICIQDFGFLSVPCLDICYGQGPVGSKPLNLDLTKYSTFRLSFAGLITDSVLTADIGVWFHGVGRIGPEMKAVLAPSLQPFTREVSFESYRTKHVPFPNFADIDAINIVLQSGSPCSFGITCFEAI